MKALQWQGSVVIKLHTEQDPTPRLGEALLRVKAVGLGGSDLHCLLNGGTGDSKRACPIIFGHETSPEMKTGLMERESVAIDPAIHCDQCRLCFKGHPNLCPTQDFTVNERCDCASLVTHHYPLPDFELALIAANNRNGPIGIVELA